MGSLFDPHLRTIRSGATTPSDVQSSGGITVFIASPKYASGSVDAYAYLQGLLDAAADAGHGRNAEVVLPRGTYKLSNMLQIPDGVDLIGSKGAVLDVSGVDMLTAVCAIGTTGTKVKGIKIIGSGKGSQPANNTTGPTYSLLRLSGSGIIFAGVIGGLIEDCWTENCGGLTGALPYNGVSGIWITWACKDTVVRYNRTSACRNSINEDNFFCAAGSDPSGNKIIGNTCLDGRFGIALDSASAAKDTKVLFNTVRNMQQSGIDLNKAQRAIVSQNYIENCGLENGNHGIWLYGTGAIPCFNVTISCNIIVGCKGSGIKMGPYVYWSSANDNHCISNEKYGVFVLGLCRYYEVNRNKCRANLLDGILMQKYDSASVITTGQVCNNELFGNYNNGIVIRGGAEIIVSGNLIKDNGQAEANTYDGIRLFDATTLCTFTGNQSSGGLQRYALGCTDSGTSGNTFSANVFQAGASGRLGFANLNQNWGDNGDGTITVAGPPTGTYPYGARVFSTADNKLYVNTSSGWKSVLAS